MKTDHTPIHDPLRTDTPGLGPAPLRHDISQDISGTRTETWETRPRRRAQWPFWVAGLAVVGVAAAMMFDMKPEQWVSAHLERPAPASETVPLPLPSQPAPQAQTDVPPLPQMAQAPATVAAPAPVAPAAPAAAESARSRTEPAAARDSSRSTVTQGALQPRDEPAMPTPPAAATPSPTSEPAPVPADPKPVPVDPAAPATGS